MDLPRHQTSMTVLMTPDTVNFAGNVHGGTILKLLDQVAYACASRWSGQYVVTRSVDQVVFREPVHVGELVTFLASINHTGRSSMEVGVKVLAEDVRSGAARHVNSCFFTMVAVNAQREAVAVRCWQPGNADDQRRHAAAAVRRELRLEQARRLAA
jgi:acyl-CoA hydrolase